MNDLLLKAAKIIENADRVVAFTGAGISVESGIPPFRGKEGLWSSYDPKILDLVYFHSNPADSWFYIREIFYDHFGQAQANIAHKVLAWMEKEGFLNEIITQNIDNLHSLAGNTDVIEFHGTSARLLCEKCSYSTLSEKVDLDKLPPICPDCNSVLKPDFVFFGEGIPQKAYTRSMNAVQRADCMIIVGTTGEIMPASMLPDIAKKHGAKIIEINPEVSNFTHTITDIYFPAKASVIFSELKQILALKKSKST